ncbi:nuclear transport factor 2 family protein [Acanthopleuribacter pedis]|uniref:Nuclear transport factor 2 family protein n=1 Tax=Acanthopleuribacter pedis TaxID=442870 RepID=A0A8J7U5Q9_9BACT|nr:nuclear transport factor 2 family protein [Acanthopleuribacter pedis]MBO1322818.1 nuclear transport factor 2 family protein [Acanthopleuribacter pedis]
MLLLMMMLVMNDYPKVEGSGNLQVLGDQYLRALEHENATMLAKLIADDIHFHEPSATCFNGKPLEAKGKEAFMRFWGGSFAVTHRLEFDIRHAFETGPWAVYYLISKFESDRSIMDGKEGRLRGSSELMIMLRFKDGKVVEHIGFPNCDTLVRQLEAQISK